MKFLVDANVGKLARWLRILGYDTLFAGDMDDAQIVDIALKENRVILTKDNQIKNRRLASTGQLKVVFINDDRPEKQMRQIINDLGIMINDKLFSRCLECNQPLEPEPKDKIEELVPPYVFKTQENYMRCPLCGRIYWRGTHWQRMKQRMENFFS